VKVWQPRDLLDQSHKSVWPISGVTCMLEYENGADAAKWKGGADFFTGSLNNGQKVTEELRLVPLPASVVKWIEAEMKNIK